MRRHSIVVPQTEGAPRVSRKLIWPNYMSHAVEYGTAEQDEDRIVVAFNA